MTFPKAKITAIEPSAKSTIDTALWDVLVQSGGAHADFTFTVVGVTTTKARAWKHKSDDGTLELKIG